MKQIDNDTPLAAPRYRTVAAFEDALVRRLKQRVTPQRTYQDLRKELAFDRILARLVRVSPDAWLLKGGVALEYRLRLARATSDIDISANGDVDTITDSFREAASIDMKDYFAIRFGEITRPVDDVLTCRFAVDVLYSNGRPFEPIRVDVGFADPWLGEAQRLRGRPLLDFIGIEPVVVKAIPIAQHLAEKIHAYTKRYGAHGSTRVKDLVDIVLLIDVAPIDDEAQADCIREVFTSRGTHAIPTELPAPPNAWRAPFAKLAAGLPVPPDCADAHDYVTTRLKATLAIAAAGS